MPSTDPEATTGRIDADDVGKYGEAHRPIWSLEYEQLSRGCFEATKSYRHAGRALLYDECHNQDVRVVGQLAPGSIAVGVINRSGRSGRWWGNSFPDHGIPFATHRLGIDLVLPAGYRGLVAVVPEQELRERLGILTGSEPRWLDRDGTFLLAPRANRTRLQAGWTTLLEMGSRNLLDDLAGCLARALPEPADSRVGISSRAAVVRRAVELQDAAESPLSIDSICLALRTSSRTLHNAFTSQVGEPPARYLKIRRMNRARHRLARGARGCETVSQIALDCGFREFGRFAVDYRKLFGVTPSETLGSGGASRI